MSKTAREISTLALFGLAVGLMLGVLAAGVYTTWRSGGDIANTGFGAFFEHAPWVVGGFKEPFKTGLMILGGVAAVLAVATAAIGYKPKRTSHGSAEWAKPQELRKAGLTSPVADVLGPIYGKMGGPKSGDEFFTSSDIPHSLIAAPTGSGKGVGVVIPTLLTYKGSVFCLDVKGENFALTARRRVAMGDRVFKFAPYDPHGRTHRFNPLEYIAEIHPRRRFTEARRLAASLVVAHGNGQGFLEGAREVFAACALLAIERGKPRISAVYDALAEPGEAFELFQRLAREVKSEEAKKIFNRMGGMESRILSSYLSVLADGGLGLWADPAVRAATDASDFGIENLRRDPTSVFVIVSPNDLVPLAPLIRLMFQQTIAVLQRAEPGKDEPYPVLFLLDEFASLGRMEVLQQAVTTLRGYGGRIMIVVQTLASLRDQRLYGREGAAVFLANCRLQLFMSPADEDTPEYVSKAIGDFTRLAKSKSWRSNEWVSNYSEREEGVRLIRAAELRQLGSEKIVALVQNMKPVIAERVSYYEDKQLLPLFEGQTGRMPEPHSLHPEDTNPFLAKRMAQEQQEDEATDEDDGAEIETEDEATGEDDSAEIEAEDEATAEDDSAEIEAEDEATAEDDSAEIEAEDEATGEDDSAEIEAEGEATGEDDSAKIEAEDEATAEEKEATAALIVVREKSDRMLKRILDAKSRRRVSDLHSEIVPKRRKPVGLKARGGAAEIAAAKARNTKQMPRG
ncbi:type IV secretion system ATPase VirD4 (plasmid) [Acuticoccus sp. MNP-M23]|uniref:type IV secretion system ATPase VirD4 n=1 Tax=Acuticoccus sp. MNP-M23 TaxID=3072793 RepID=UPI00281613EC|nr:type IV secretion system ATPase VirD4 [Acuticoccus sp. MNP-M23]WMS45230.1 type IV secretion system ATPase VirD4 [Acuticoccus sp. MNP-M23]